MPAITINERDFDFLAGAAIDAKRAGDMKAAIGLDKLARMANLALSHQTARLAAGPFGTRNNKGRWQDMPSTIESFPI